MNLEFIKPQNLGSLLMKSSQSNFNLRSPGSYLARSYLIAKLVVHISSLMHKKETNSSLKTLFLFVLFYIETEMDLVVPDKAYYVIL